MDTKRRSSARYVGLLRELLGEDLTQAQVAERVGSSQDYVSKLIQPNTSRQAGQEKIDAAIAKMRLDPSYFYGDEEPKSYKDFRTGSRIALELKVERRVDASTVQAPALGPVDEALRAVAIVFGEDRAAELRAWAEENVEYFGPEAVARAVTKRARDAHRATDELAPAQSVTPREGTTYLGDPPKR